MNDAIGKNWHKGRVTGGTLPSNNIDTELDFDEAEYALNNCIRITLNVEDYTTEVRTRNGWMGVREYVLAYRDHEIAADRNKLIKHLAFQLGEDEEHLRKLVEMMK